MKILLAHNFYRSSAPSGEDTVYRTERRLLEEQGYEIIPYERYNDDIDDSIVSNRVRLARDGAWSRQSYDDLTALVGKFKPDVAHFHNTFPLISPSAITACRNAGIPVVQTLHNFRLICPQAMLLREGRPCERCLRGTLGNALLYRCYRSSFAATLAQVWTQLYNRYRGTYRNNVSRFIVLTNFAAKKFMHAGYPSRQMSVLSNTLLDSPPAGNGNDGDYVLYVGRLSHEKGVLTMLNAWSSLNNIPLKIVGDGPLRKKLEQIVHENNLNIEFWGCLGKQDVFKAIQRALIQVVPSEWYEGFPNVLLEAMACGTPVVASRIGSLDEIVLDGITGIKFSPGNAGDLAAAVKGLVNEPEKLASMRISARDHFERKYAPSGHVAQLVEIYRDVILEMKKKAVGHGTSVPSRY